VITWRPPDKVKRIDDPCHPSIEDHMQQRQFVAFLDLEIGRIIRSTDEIVKRCLAYQGCQVSRLVQRPQWTHLVRGQARS
jgi:hypothetical protein